MRKVILCGLVVALGVGVYFMVDYSKKHPKTVVAQGVQTASEVGTRSNPFIEPPEEEAEGFPSIEPLPSLEDPATIEDIFSDPMPVGGEPTPFDPGMTPTSFTDPIKIDTPLPALPIEAEEPVNVFPVEDGPIQPVMPYTIGDKPSPNVTTPTMVSEPTSVAPAKKMPYADEDPTE